MEFTKNADGYYESEDGRQRVEEFEGTWRLLKQEDNGPGWLVVDEANSKKALLDRAK